MTLSSPILCICKLYYWEPWSYSYRTDSQDSDSDWGPVLVYWVCSWLTCGHGMIQILKNRSGLPKRRHSMRYVDWMIWDNATKKQNWSSWKLCKGLFNDIFLIIIKSHCSSPIKTFSMYLKVIVKLYQVWRYYVLKTLRIFYFIFLLTVNTLNTQHRDNSGQNSLFP